MPVREKCVGGKDGNVRAAYAARLLVWIVVMLFLPASALAQGAGAPPGNPRLASLNIEIWPEYDRPAALVIINALLAEEVKLPASVTLRLPAASGGASAVAYATAADGRLLNLKHETVLAGDYASVKFDVPERFFHVEFYEPIAIGAPARSYRYVWPGDFAADKVTVGVQEPASASAISAEPKLEGTSTGKDGLRYRAAELGAMAAGKALPIEVRYTKTDARPSTEILQPAGSVAASPSPPPVAAAPAGAASGAPPRWIIALMAAVMVVMLGGIAFLWWRQRDRSSQVRTDTPQRSCRKCGATQAPENRYCGSCGAKV